MRLSGRTSILSADLLRILPWLLLGVAGARAVLGAAQWFCWERIGEKTSYRIRRDLAHAYLNLDPTARRHQKFQDIESGLAPNFSNDIRLVREYIVHFFGGIPREGLQSLFLVGILLSINPRLFGIFAIGFVPVIAILTEWGKKLRRRARTALKDFSGVSEWIQQRLLGIETIKHYRSEEFEVKSMSQQIDRLNTKFLRAARVKARTSPTIEAFSVLAIGAVIYVALSEVYGQRVSGMSQVTFFATLAVLGQNLSKLGKYLNSNREGRAGCDRIFGALEALRSHMTPNVRANFKVSVSPQVFIAAENVFASYPERTEDALVDVSFRFGGGRIHCLCGPSGAGKSTLFQLLLGTLSPSKGSISLGLPKDLKVERAISYLPQNAPLFPGSLLENIFWPHSAGDEKRAAECLAQVGLTPLLQELPEGPNTLVGEGGRALSGGQSQRLHLARISYHHANIYLIDEGTSALDPELEKLVFEMLRRLAKRGAAVIMIAHRMAAADMADEILLLKNGRLTAHGEPARMKPMLAELYR